MSADVEAIRARADAASVAPWSWDEAEVECGSCCTPNGCMGHDSGLPETLGNRETIVLTVSEVTEIGAGHPDGGVEIYAQWKRDAAFIAAARTDVPLLCDELTEARARVAALEAERDRTVEGVERFDNGALHEVLTRVRNGENPSRALRVVLTGLVTDVGRCPSVTGGGRYRCAFDAGHAGLHRAKGVHNTWTDDQIDAARDAGRARGETAGG